MLRTPIYAHREKGLPVLCENAFQDSFQGELILITSPGGGESEKLKKGDGSMVQGQVFLKRRGLKLFLFDFFKVYHFYI